jgi:hypothetical protein
MADADEDHPLRPVPAIYFCRFMPSRGTSKNFDDTGTEASGVGCSPPGDKVLLAGLAR